MALLQIRPDSSKYRDSRLLARTLMGLTYEAIPISSDASADALPVVVKLLSIATVPAGCREELIVEYQACTKADCFALAQVNSVRFTSGAALITVESPMYHCSLETLVAQTGGKGLPPSQVSEILTQLLTGLVHMHDPNETVGLIIHRNLQPRNVLVDKDGFIHISDFAFCRALTAVSLMSPSFGNRKFMSPEAAQDLPLDEKTDIWSFGCLAIYMLTGAPPAFPPNLNIDQDIAVAVSSIIDSIRSKIRPALNEEKELVIFDCLLSIVSSCLSFDPLDRPSAVELCNEEPFLTTRSYLLEKFPHIFKSAPSSLSTTSLEKGCDGAKNEGNSLEALKQAIIDNSLVQVRRYMDTFDLHASQMVELGIEHKSYLVLPMLCRRIVERNLCVSVKKRKGEVVAERTNLMKAAWDGDTEGVKKYLHEAGKLWYDDTALMRAARGGNLHCVKLLLCEMGIQNSGMMTSLMYTAQKGHIECLKYLLAESRYRDSQDVTALIIAVRAGYPECVRLLKGRENDMVDKENKSAYEHALAMPFPFISEDRYKRCAKMLASAETHKSK
ncbi:Kinase, NEK [Giardia lamblia P15]|uniref:non-specific serine/threonine protein kinase n=1 Tax=Giardia intestinalis (strain P15) TaxID=658858 RepID=E1EWB9_GIAIA|nr:Kinase, NEK [Giardia lamblia P15]